MAGIWGSGVMRPAILGATITALHPDLIDYINRVRLAGGEVADTKIGLLNAAIYKAYQDGLRSYTGTHLIKYCWAPTLVTSFTGSNVPLWKPSDVGNANLINFVSGDWSTTQGLKGNGTNKYVNTGFIPSAQLSSDTQGSLLIWEPVRSTVNYITFGCQSGTHTQMTYYYDGTSTSEYGIGLYRDSANATDAGIYFSSGRAAGLIQGWKNGNTIKLLRDGSILSAKSTVSAHGTRPNRNFMLFAFDGNGTISRYSNGNIKMVMLGEGLSDALATAQYNFALAIG